MIDLISKISELDKKRLNNFINAYGIKTNFIGLEEWLQQWSHSNQLLYKMLGNKLIYKTDFTYEKNDKEILSQIQALNREKAFGLNWKQFCDFLSFDKHIIDSEDCYNMAKILRSIKEISFSAKIRKPNCNKELRLQTNMKPMKAISQIMKYFSEEIKEFEDKEDDVSSLSAEFEEYRIANSMILNDKNIKGELCFSIHPFDYLTMSDNDSSWTSCMSWKEQGCYHVGTVEMMNSNNVICCYITKSTPYCFSEEKDVDKDKEEWNWNNKKWRQLFYIDKSIIVGGKPYPYVNDKITKSALSIIKDLIEKNLNWKYAYGPELYNDMKHINGLFSMERAHDYVSCNINWKKNILFDTNGMYNDMLNDSSTPYWCYRNKVKKTKFIKYSGKAPCLCCGKNTVICREDYDFEDVDYNERYSNVGSVVCESCLADNFECYNCGAASPHSEHYKIEIDGEERLLCKYCLAHIKICPDCGKPFFVNDFNVGGYTSYVEKIEPLYIRLQDKSKDDILDVIRNPLSFIKRKGVEKILEVCYTCKSCQDKHKNDFTYTRIEREQEKLWDCYKKDFYLSNKIYDVDDPNITKYFYENLAPYSVGE